MNNPTLSLQFAFAKRLADPFNPAGIKATPLRLRNGRHRVVAYIEDENGQPKIIAYANIKIDHNSVEMNFINTLPEYQRHRAASSLMRFLAAETLETKDRIQFLFWTSVSDATDLIYTSFLGKYLAEKESLGLRGKFKPYRSGCIFCLERKGAAIKVNAP